MRQALFARALEKAHTGRALARTLHRTEQQISNWKTGRDPIPNAARRQQGLDVAKNIKSRRDEYQATSGNVGSSSAFIRVTSSGQPLNTPP